MKNYKTFIVVAIFASAMGLLETIVVVYLRQLYYPQGFDFPLAVFSPDMLGIELLREAATLVMLISVGMMAGRTGIQRFAWFLYSFAIWDIMYYAGLKWLLDWPSSFLTWDVLFLIPVTWVGPVLAPLICSVSMIILSWCMLYFRERGLKPTVEKLEWTLLILGALLIFSSFIRDYFLLLTQGGYLSRLSKLANDADFQRLMSTYKPSWFNWYLFGVGELVILAGILLMILRYRGKIRAISLAKQPESHT